jgi:hypothetical protein
MIDTEDKSVIASEAWKSHKMRLYFDYDFISLYGIATLRSQRHPKSVTELLIEYKRLLFWGLSLQGQALSSRSATFSILLPVLS